MKLIFSIHYNTAWGESLHIRMEYRSQDGTVKSHDYTMLTEDGNLWTLETAALESRQHAYHFFLSLPLGYGVRQLAPTLSDEVLCIAVNVIANSTNNAKIFFIVVCFLVSYFVQ